MKFVNKVTNQEEQGLRLEHLLQTLKINQSELARMIKVSPSLINQIIKGQKALSHKVLSRLTNGYNQVNASWLLNNEGEMFFEKKEPEPGVLEGVLEPEVEYGKGEGRLEWLERKVRELESRVRRLEEKRD